MGGYNCRYLATHASTNLKEIFNVFKNKLRLSVFGWILQEKKK